MNYEGLKIKCPTCHTTEWNETTDKFDPTVSPRGDMVRLQPKWRKLGCLKCFSSIAKHYEITCGRCRASLIKKRQFTLADPLPVEPNPNWQGNPEDKLSSELVEKIREDVKVEPADFPLPAEPKPLQLISMVEVEVEPKADDIFPACSETAIAIPDQPEPSAPAILEGSDLLAAYREFKLANPESTWRQSYEAIPNEYPDHLKFASIVRALIKEESE